MQKSVEIQREGLQKFNAKPVEIQYTIVNKTPFSLP